MGAEIRESFQVDDLPLFQCYTIFKLVRALKTIYQKLTYNHAFCNLLVSTKKSKKLVHKSPLIICILDPLICVPCIYTASPPQRTNVDLAKALYFKQFFR